MITMRIIIDSLVSIWLDSILLLKQKALHWQHDLQPGALDSESIFSDWIRKKLQRYPRWYKGHLVLAHTALLNKNFRLSYSSALAAQKLSRNDTHTFEALLLLSNITLQAQDARGALDVLEKIPHNQFSKKQVKRFYTHKAAVLMALEDYQSTREIIETYDLAKDDAAIRAAYDFVKGK